MIERTRTQALIVLLLAASTAVACEKEQETEKTKTTDAGSAKEAIDPNLAEALEGATPAQAAADPAVGPGGGPPPNGVFEQGKADEQAKAGEPPKVELGGEGQSPRVRVPAVPKPGTKQKAAFRLATRVLPPVDLTLTLTAKKGDDEKAGVPVVAEVSKVALAPSQPGTIPKEIEVQAKKLRGVKVSYRVLPNGGGVGFSHESVEDAALGSAIDAMQVALEIATLPVPDKPVGAGGFWMVTTRDRFMSGDVVTYRLVRVESAGADQLDLSIVTKRYAAGPKLSDAAGFEIIQYQAQAETKLTLAQNQGYPMASEVKDQAQIILKEEGSPMPQQGMPLQGIRPLQYQAVTRFQLATD